MTAMGQGQDFFQGLPNTEQDKGPDGLGQWGKQHM